LSANNKISRLSFATLLFPLALVLFEFAVYIANDMAQPAMLQVTREFGVDAGWVPLSMTFFLLGGAALSWLTGPLSDRYGRRPVLLGGVVFFIVSCLATYLVSSIEAYMALRVLQGMGLCFINAVGYAAVQEAYAEKTAVRVTALMANVALIAPMVGPLAGAALVEVAPWRSCFLFIAACALLALLGLWWKMPETVRPAANPRPLSSMGGDYLQLLRDRRFVLSVLCIPLLALPLMGWIALSPVLLVEDLGMSTLAYGLWQLPVFGGLVAGNLLLAARAEAWSATARVSGAGHDPDGGRRGHVFRRAVPFCADEQQPAQGCGVCRHEHVVHGRLRYRHRAVPLGLHRRQHDRFCPAVGADRAGVRVAGAPASGSGDGRTRRPGPAAAVGLIGQPATPGGTNTEGWPR